MCGLWVFWGGCVLLFFMVGVALPYPPCGVCGCEFLFFFISILYEILYIIFLYIGGMCIYRTYDKYIVHIVIIFFNVHICTLVLFYVHGDKIVILGGGVVFDIFLTQIGEN